jgi:hypothetical protein
MYCLDQTKSFIFKAVARIGVNSVRDLSEFAKFAER